MRDSVAKKDDSQGEVKLLCDDIGPRKSYNLRRQTGGTDILSLSAHRRRRCRSSSLARLNVLWRNSCSLLLWKSYLKSSGSSSRVSRQSLFSRSQRFPINAWLRRPHHAAIRGPDKRMEASSRSPRVLGAEPHECCHESMEFPSPDFSLEM